MRARLELAALGLAAVAVAGFLLSFALGIAGSGRDPASAEPAAPQRAAGTLPEVPRPLGRVEVLNRSGRAGMARLATERLRARGYDVVFFGNAPAAAPDTSVVIDRAGRPEVARGAAAQLGIQRTMTQIDTTLYLDATVILGVDWQRGSGTDREGGAARAPQRPSFRDRLRTLLRGGG